MRWDWTPHTRAKLATFLEAAGLTRGDVTTQPIGDGHSNLTFLVSDGTRRVVVRRPPPPPTPPGAHDVLREAHVVGALAGTGVPVPRLLVTAGARRGRRRAALRHDLRRRPGGHDPVVDVRHDLTFDQLDLRSGTVEVTTGAGQVYTIETDASGRGALMAGGGYGGRHGKALGRDHLESDVYPLDGTVTQLTRDSSLTDRLAMFDWDGTPGIGIFEFALTRSRSYSYRPTLAG